MRRRADRRPVWRLLLVVMLILLAFVAFWPSPVDQPVQGLLADILRSLHRRGVPRWFNYRLVEAIANTAIFIPVGFVSSRAFPGMRWWQVGGFGLLLSGCMELGQLLFLHNRFPSPLDLVMNASGAIIGALLATVLLKRTPAALRQRHKEMPR